MRRQLLYIDLFLVEKPQKLLHIPLLRPTHVTDRIVLSPFFIELVIASRTVGTRYLKVQFLGIIRRTGQGDSNVAHEDDACFVACYFARKLYRVVAFGRRRYNNRIGAETPRPGMNLRNQPVG